MVSPIDFTHDHIKTADNRRQISNQRIPGNLMHNAKVGETTAAGPDAQRNGFL
jgi:hypothetical protein